MILDCSLIVIYDGLPEKQLFLCEIGYLAIEWIGYLAIEWIGYLHFWIGYL